MRDDSNLIINNTKITPQFDATKIRFVRVPCLYFQAFTCGALKQYSDVDLFRETQQTK